MKGLYLSGHEDFHEANELHILGRSRKKKDSNKEGNILVRHKDEWMSAKNLEWVTKILVKGFSNLNTIFV